MIKRRCLLLGDFLIRLVIQGVFKYLLLTCRENDVGALYFRTIRNIKSPCIAGFSGLYFPEFGLNPEIYRVNIRISSKWEKIWTRKNFYVTRIAENLNSKRGGDLLILSLLILHILDTTFKTLLVSPINFIKRTYQMET